MSFYDLKYTHLVQDILDDGDVIADERTGTGAIALFGQSITHDMEDGFPILTTKYVPFKSVISELLWFLRGSSNVNELRAILHGEEYKEDMEKRTIWDANYNKQAIDLGYKDGEMGDIYGVQWRDFGRETLIIEDESCKVATYDEYPINGVDQIRMMLVEARKNPSSRRLLVSAWNPKVVWDYSDKHIKVNPASLPPCHVSHQLNIVGDRIDLMWYQRSVDTFLGLPFNISSYGALLEIYGRILDKKPRKLAGMFGNTHIYSNHVDQLKEQCERRVNKKLPTLWINPKLKTLDDFLSATVDDFKLIGYEHDGVLKGKMAV